MGDLYSNGEFDIDIEKAKYYFSESIKIHDKKISVYNKENDLSSIYFIYNNYFYHANNDLGLIILINDDNFENADQYIKKAALNEYPFGQNNYGLLKELYYNDFNGAKYFYKKSSKTKFALADYNLGHLKEKKGNKEKSIKFYIKASDNENSPLIFHSFEHSDKRLNISKTFIICLTNLKLTVYYFSNKSFDEAKKYFIRSFSNIIKDKSYQFIVKFHEDNCSYVFEYLQKFILNCPLFNLLNQPNLSSNIKEKIKSFEDENYYSIEEEEESKDDDYNLNEINDKNQIKEKLKFTKIENKKNDKNENHRKFIFDDLSKLFDFINSNEYLKNIFVNEIENIISIMNEILYSKPYPILFGRINNIKPKPLTKINTKLKNINKSFYEGFGI